jgi:hypothetical protein
MLKLPGDIDRFAASAQPGDWATYGRGDHPPRELVRAMRPYVDAGVLVPTSKRDAGGLLYLVKRVRGSLPQKASRRAPAQRSWRQQGKLDLARVLQALTLAARRGAPCPSYRDLAQRLGMSWRAARHRVDQLVKSGTISSAFDERTGWRVVTILTGRFAGCSTMAAPAGIGPGPQGETE